MLLQANFKIVNNLSKCNKSDNCLLSRFIWTQIENVEIFELLKLRKINKILN